MVMHKSFRTKTWSLEGHFGRECEKLMIGRVRHPEVHKYLQGYSIEKQVACRYILFITCVYICLSSYFILSIFLSIMLIAAFSLSLYMMMAER